MYIIVHWTFILFHLFLNVWHSTWFLTCPCGKSPIRFPISCACVHDQQIKSVFCCFCSATSECSSVPVNCDDMRVWIVSECAGLSGWECVNMLWYCCSCCAADTCPLSMGWDTCHSYNKRPCVQFSSQDTLFDTIPAVGDFFSQVLWFPTFAFSLHNSKSSELGSAFLANQHSC